MSDLEYRCPACHGSVDPAGDNCPICGAPLAHAIVHAAARETIFPEPILVRHAEDTPAVAMHPTMHMHKNTAPTVSAGVYGEEEDTMPHIPAPQAIRPTDHQTAPAETPDSQAVSASDANTAVQKLHTDGAPSAVETQKDTPLRYVVVGGGVAGLHAAEAIRETDPQGEITLLCGEQIPPYRRTALSRELSACATRDGLALRTKEQYRAARIRVLCDATVTDVDVSAQTVRTVAEVLPYDRLVLAVGSEPVHPTVSGQSLAGVLTLRELADARALLRRLPYLERVAILGGGLLGVSLACTLAREGCLVTLVESSHALLPDLLHRSTAAELARILADGGIDLRLGVACTHIQGRDRVIGIVTEDGHTTPCDSVLLCCGTRPRTALARLLGIPSEQGIPTDAYLQTPLPHIWACGDCVHTTLPAGVHRNWQFAVESGEAAGKNAAGAAQPFRPRLTPVVLPVFDEKLCAVGDCGQDKRETYHIVSHQTAGARGFSEFFFRADRLVGASVIGADPNIAALVDAVEKGLPLAEFFATHAFRMQGAPTLA